MCLEFVCLFGQASLWALNCFLIFTITFLLNSYECKSSKANSFTSVDALPSAIRLSQGSLPGGNSYRNPPNLTDHSGVEESRDGCAIPKARSRPPSRGNLGRSLCDLPKRSPPQYSCVGLEWRSRGICFHSDSGASSSVTSACDSPVLGRAPSADVHAPKPARRSSDGTSFGSCPSVRASNLRALPRAVSLQIPTQLDPALHVLVCVLLDIREDEGRGALWSWCIPLYVFFQSRYIR
jgi:hypothetical protein